MLDQISSEILWPCIGAVVALLAYIVYTKAKKAKAQAKFLGLQKIVEGSEKNNMSMIHEGLAAGAKLTDTIASTRKQAIHYAAQHDSLLVLQYLITQGVNIDATDMAKMTALHFACMKGKESAIKMLIKNGCDVAARDMAEYNGLHFAALNGHHGTCTILIDAGSLLDERDKLGNTALMLSACKAKEKTVEVLLTRGCDRYLRGKNDITALDFAYKKKSSVCIDLLEGKIKTRPAPAPIPVNNKTMGGASEKAKKAAKAKSEPKAKNKAEAKDTDAKTEAKKDKKSDFKFDKAMKPIEEGEAGYQKTVAPAKKAGTSKLEALLAKHEKETQKDVEGKSKDYADKLSKGGFECMSAFDKNKAKEVLDGLKESGDMDEHIKALGLDKLE